jgi:hypothetical protein
MAWVELGSPDYFAAAEACRAAYNAQRIRAEAALHAEGVPEVAWVWILYNHNRDGLGSWCYTHAQWQTEVTWYFETFKAMPPVDSGRTHAGTTVVDGRAVDAITAYVRRSWRGEGCLRSTEADSIREWEAWRNSPCQ